MGDLKPLIGIVGGVGVQAGIDLAEKISAETIAGSDQEHLPFVLLSRPDRIPDRTAYLLGTEPRNPAGALFELLRDLETAGATVAGIPCNTAHAEPIFGEIQKNLAKAGSRLKLIHMIRETMQFIRKHHPGIQRVGVLSTTGSYTVNLHANFLTENGFTPVLPGAPTRIRVHAAIYHVTYGIKAQTYPIHPVAVEELHAATAELKSLGAEAVILGCTEIPLALPERVIDGMAAIDPARILARALVKEVDAKKLKGMA
ncbi:MAG: amino acid racemase [Planctomycetota bacterium]